MFTRNRFLLAGLTFLLPFSLEAAPEYVRLSFATENTDTEIGIAWNTEASESSLVQFGTSPSYGSQVEGSSLKGSSPLGWIHEATLSGLSPATTYYYRVGGPEDGWSDGHSFTTGPAGTEACSKFNFVVIGDSRSQSPRGSSIVFHDIMQEIVTNEDPAFVLHGGDIVNEAEVTSQWLVQLEDIADLTPYYSLMFTMGNHDDGPVDGPSAYYNQVYQLPLNPETKVDEFAPYAEVEDFYYFTYGNAIFVTLSTQTFTDFEVQADWLDKVLTENPRQWKFVTMHHPIYTSNPLGLFHDPNEKGHAEYFVPVIDKHHVDIVFTSHNHFYERFQPSYGGTDGTPQPVESFAEGTVYVVTGGGGAATPPFSICDAEGSLSCSGKNHYVSIDIDGDVLSYEAHRTETQLYGRPTTNIVFDSFQIDKSETESCR